MKLKLLLFSLFTLFIAVFSSGQSTINITTTGGSYLTEKWVNITDMADGAGTQIWGQGDGSYGNAQGLINQDITLPPGTYWVNCYDRFADGWDGTTIDVTAYGASIGNNGGVSPDDGTDTDSSSAWETPVDELETSFMIVVPNPPSCQVATGITSSNILEASVDFSWTVSASETGGYNWEVVPQGDAQGVNVVTSGTTMPGASTVSFPGLSSDTSYDFYIQTNCGTSAMSTWAGPIVFTTAAACGDTVYDTGGVAGDYSNNESYTITYVPDTAANLVTLDFTSVDVEAGYDFLTLYDGLDNTAPILVADLQVPGVYTALNTSGAITLEFTSDSSFVQGGWAANYTCTPRPSCVNVSGITVDSSTSDSVTVSWTDNNVPAGTAWEVVAVAAGAPAPAVGTSNATTNPFAISSLLANTSYDVYVRADCSTTFIGPISATTECTTFVPDSMETFTTFVPDCWEVADDGDLTTGFSNVGTSRWLAEEFAHVGTGNGAVNINLYTNNVSDWILSPVYDLSAGGYELNLDVALTNYNNPSADVMGSDDFVALAYTTDGTTWTALQTWDVNNQPATAGETYNDALTGITSASVRFGIYATDGTVNDLEDYDFHIDNFQVRTAPVCNDVTGVTIDSVTTDSVTVSWTENSVPAETLWEVVAVAAGDPAPAVGTSNATTTAYAITGLNSSTAYDIYVRGECSITFVGPMSATTVAACGDTVYDTGGVAGDYSNNESYTITYVPDTAANVVTLDFTSVDVEAGYDFLTLYDGLDTSAPILVADLQVPGVYTALNTSGAITLEFTSDSSFVQGGWAANYTCTPRPSCVNVTGITIDSVTTDSVTVSWIDNNIPAGTAWEVVAVAAGAPAPAVGTSNATTNPFAISSLLANTSYDVYVRADCSTTFAGPISATTPCTAVVAPYTEDFENAGATPNCWTLGGDDIWEFNLTGPNHVGNAGVLSGSTSSGAYYAVLDDSSPEATDAQLISPLVDVSGLTSPALSFYEISDNEGQASATLTVSVWDGAAWNLMGTYSGNTSGWELKTINLSNLTFTGPAQARFSVADSGSFYDDIAIDDVTFDEVLTCLNVSGITVDSSTSDSVTVSWTENNIPAGTAWEVVAVAAGAPAPAVGTSNATTNSFEISSLLANTSYDVYVRADCSTTFIGPISATTDCDVVTAYPYMTDFTNNVPNACWEEAGSGEITDGPMTVGSSDWKSGRAYTNLGGTVIPSNVINIWQTNTDREWLISEQYDMTGVANDVLSIEVAVTNYRSTGTSTAMDTDNMDVDDQVDLLITTDGGITWTSLVTWNATNQPLVTGTRENIDLSSYSGTVQFAIFASDGAIGGTQDYDFHVGMFSLDGTAGSEDTFVGSLSLYPNPVDGDVVTIRMDLTSTSSIDIAVFNTLGQQVITRSYDQVTNSVQIDNLSSLSKGMYFVKILNGSQQATLKFIKE